MSKVIAFAERQRVAEQAAAWLIKLDQQCPPDDADKQAFKNWLSQSDTHRQEFESLIGFWQNQSLTELSVPLESNVVTADSDPSYKESSVVRHLPSASAQNLWLKVGGALAATVLLSLALLFFHERSITGQGNGYYATVIGQQATIPLGDGSIVELNTNSQIKVEFNEQERAVYLLQGEAYFDVEKNPSKPFHVYAGQSRVQAIGTAFSVYLLENDVDVVVTEGKVALAVSVPDKESEPIGQPPIEAARKHSLSTIGVLEAGEGATLLLAERGQQGTDKTSLQPLRFIDPDSIQQRHDWRNGLISFRGESLEEALAKISRYTNLSIEISNPEIKKIRIGGQFRTDYIEEVFDILRTNFGLTVTELDGNRIQISQAKKSQEAIRSHH